MYIYSNGGFFFFSWSLDVGSCSVAVPLFGVAITRHFFLLRREWKERKENNGFTHDNNIIRVYVSHNIVV
jgi:hypothetical protein